jgi:hypothetical protein
MLVLYTPVKLYEINLISADHMSVVPIRVTNVVLPSVMRVTVIDFRHYDGNCKPTVSISEGSDGYTLHHSMCFLCFRPTSVLKGTRRPFADRKFCSQIATPPPPTYTPFSHHFLDLKQASALLYLTKATQLML